MLPIASLSSMSAPYNACSEGYSRNNGYFVGCFFFQGLALGVKYFYKLNPDFLLEVINDYLVYAPTEVCIIITVRFLFVLFFSNKLPSDFHGRLRVQTPEGEKLRVFK